MCYPAEALRCAGLHLLWELLSAKITETQACFVHNIFGRKGWNVLDHLLTFPYVPKLCINAERFQC